MVLEQVSVDAAVSLLQKLIQNQCVNPPGDELKSIITIQDYLSENNIESELIKTDTNRANLIAVIKGTENGPSLMLGPAHVDVVPIAKPESWKEDPFEGIIKDGYIWGRGTMDMLFIVATQVQAFIELSKENFKPKGDLILVIVADEEAGGEFGAKWLADNRPELMKVDYAVSEAGGIPLDNNKLIYCIGEKGTAWKRIRFKGTPGHGSSPYKSDNAVVKASLAAYRLSKYNAPAELKYVREMMKGIGVNPIIRSLIGIKPLFSIILFILHKQSPTLASTLHAVSRMTISPNILHGGKKTNVIPGDAYIDVDIRTLPGQDDEYVRKHVSRALGNLAKEAILEVPDESEFSGSDGNYSEITSEFLDAMREAVSDYYPDATFVPIMVSGATDLRFIRNLGGRGFGFSLFDPELKLSDMNLAHAPNERVSLKTVEYSLNAYYRLCKVLLSDK
ncbi:MAG: M20/M25/M40 family metallo-hydrolase [Candidatus Heimdallarchaeota archaeon]|nr:M20/M25/M40 family metallo-hydrolase [Candidatus Heimdallarchaeota archaeon]